MERKRVNAKLYAPEIVCPTGILSVISSPSRTGRLRRATDIRNQNVQPANVPLNPACHGFHSPNTKRQGRQGAKARRISQGDSETVRIAARLGHAILPPHLTVSL